MLIDNVNSTSLTDNNVALYGLCNTCIHLDGQNGNVEHGFSRNEVRRHLTQESNPGPLQQKYVKSPVKELQMMTRSGTHPPFTFSQQPINYNVAGNADNVLPRTRLAVLYSTTLATRKEIWYEDSYVAPSFNTDLTPIVFSCKKKTREPDQVEEVESEPVPQEVRDIHDKLAIFDGIILVESGTYTLPNNEELTCKHTYIDTKDGSHDFTSTTTYIHRLFDEFDKDKVALGVVRGQKWRDKTSEYYVPAMRYAMEHVQVSGQVAILRNRCMKAGKDIETFYEDFPNFCDFAERMRVFKEMEVLCMNHIKSTWEMSSEMGTAMHEILEFFFSGDESLINKHRHLPVMEQALHWVNTWYKERKLIPIKMEQRVVDRLRRITGSIDGLWWDTVNKHVVQGDWKFVKNLTKESYKGKMGKGPCAHMPDSNYYHYEMQQGMYMLMLESAGIFVKEAYLIQFHSTTLCEFNMVHVPCLDDNKGEGVPTLRQTVLAALEYKP